VLLVGENGSGKEEMARLIHSASRRAGGPFVEGNCAAIPEELIESELFGHVKGAFTGAIKDQMGKFREADGGTLFLDEVGDMSLKTQAKVLRALQEGRVEPVGGGPIVVYARVIAATNKDLGEEMRAGRFREDLYFRLAVVPLRVPPLRERQDEIVPLAEAFIARTAKAYGKPPKRLSEGVVQALLRHEWPGNVRELKNAMERAMILTRGGEISAKDVGPQAVGGAAGLDAESLPEFSSLQEAREWFDGAYIQRELKQQAGSVTRAAERLGLDRSSLRRRMRALGIEHGGA
jgi:two-component system nitrogen regulation response regulator NtrX